MACVGMDFLDWDLNGAGGPAGYADGLENTAHLPGVSAVLKGLRLWMLKYINWETV